MSNKLPDNADAAGKGLLITFPSADEETGAQESLKELPRLPKPEPKIKWCFFFLCAIAKQQPKEEKISFKVSNMCF